MIYCVAFEYTKCEKNKNDNRTFHKWAIENYKVEYINISLNKIFAWIVILNHLKNKR